MIALPLLNEGLKSEGEAANDNDEENKKTERSKFSKERMVLGNYWLPKQEGNIQNLVGEGSVEYGCIVQVQGSTVV